MRKRINFTKATLLSLKPPAPGKRLVVWDTKVQGLQCRISGKGVKTFSLYRRLKNGRPVRVTLGKLGDMTVEQARAQATLVNAAIAKGEDPAKARRAHREEVTFGEVYHDYMENYAKPKKVSWKNESGRYRLYLEKPFGKKKLSQITRHDLASLHKKIAQSPSVKDGKSSVSRKSVQANRTLALAGLVFKWAIKTGHCTENPVRGIDMFAEKSRDRFLQPEELMRFFDAVQKEQDSNLRHYILLSLYTGARQSNIVAMRWEDISFQQKVWRIPVTKNGEPVIVPLIEEALALLHNRMNNSSDFVFPANTKKGYINVPRIGWYKILARAGIKNLRPHDLRRTMGSWQAITGSSLSVIGKSLGHKSQAATAIYARLHLDPVRKSMEAATAAMLNAVQQGESMS